MGAGAAIVPSIRAAVPSKRHLGTQRVADEYAGRSAPGMAAKVHLLGKATRSARM